MNHGGLGYINSDGKLSLHPDLLDSLCFGKGSVLHGIYYPKPDGKEKESRYQKVSVEHDFMLTPIPPEFWDRSARLIVHLKQYESGTLKEVSSFLAKNHITILHSESTRSGYSFATWSLHIAFTNLDKKLNYELQGQYYKETKSELNKVITELKQECNTSLYIDEESEDLSEGTSITGWLNAELAYFHHKIIENKNIYQTFDLNLNYENGLPILYSKKFQGLLHSLNNQDGSIIPAIIFAELDTKILNIRMAVIPEKLSRRFFEMGISYKRIGNENKCIGLIHSILNNFKPNYSLWRSYNFTRENSTDLEDGSIVFLIEDNDDGVDDAFKIKRAEHTCTELLNMNIFKKNGINITKAKVSPIDKLKIKNRLERFQRKKIPYLYDVFISYFNADNESAVILNNKLKENKLIPFVFKKQVTGGSDFSEEIRDAFNNCWEVCVLFSDKTKKGQWVTTEWGAAWFQKKRITPLLIDINFKDLPDDRLKRILAMPFSDIDTYIRELIKRKQLLEYDEFDDEYSM